MGNCRSKASLKMISIAKKRQDDQLEVDKQSLPSSLNRGESKLQKSQSSLECKVQSQKESKRLEGNHSGLPSLPMKARIALPMSEFENEEDASSNSPLSKDVRSIRKLYSERERKKLKMNIVGEVKISTFDSNGELCSRGNKEFTSKKKISKLDGFQQRALRNNIKTSKGSISVTKKYRFPENKTNISSKGRRSIMLDSTLYQSGSFQRCLGDKTSKSGLATSRNQEFSKRGPLRSIGCWTPDYLVHPGKKDTSPSIKNQLRFNPFLASAKKGSEKSHIWSMAASLAEKHVVNIQKSKLNCINQ